MRAHRRAPKDHGVFIFEYLVLPVRVPGAFQVEREQVEASIFVSDRLPTLVLFAAFDFIVKFFAILATNLILQSYLDGIIRFKVSGLNTVLVVRESRDDFRQI